MDPALFTPDSPGELVATIDGARAFLPRPLPRNLPLSSTLGKLLGEARAALAELGEGGRHLPNPELFLGPLRTQEAVLSSRIEGTRTTLEDVFAHEASGPATETDEGSREVRNYIRAQRIGLDALEGGRPLSCALLKELHRVLLTDVRGMDRTPGAYRTTQVWIGESESIRNIHKARFVPPPPEHVQTCMDALEQHLLGTSDDDSLVRMALTHYQFEAIHPFNDGNGRVGRLLIVMQSIHERLQDRQWLYVSPYIEGRKQEYYDRLLEVSVTGSFDRWISFFLIAVRESALQTARKIRELRDLIADYGTRLEKSTTTAPTRLLDAIQALPYITVSMAQAWLGSRTAQTARSAIERLVDARILEEASWRTRGDVGRPARVYRCRDIVDLIERNSGA